MKTFLLFLIIGSSVTLVLVAMPEQTNIAVLRVGTNVYQNATLKQLNPLECLITDDAGWHKVAFSNLPPDIQKRFNYDPTNAVAAMSAKIAREKAAQTSSLNAQLHQSIADRLEIKYDKFHDYTLYQPTDPLNVEKHLKVSVWCLTDKGETRPTDYTLHIVSVSEEWRFLSEHAFVVIADGKKFDYGKPDDDSDTLKDGGVIEIFNITIKPGDFARMANARSFEAQLGSTTFAFEYADRQDWRDLVNYFATLPTPAAVSK